jgi:hypothetical protein
MNCKYPVRYPVGFDKNNRAKCLYCLWDGQQFKYVEARKAIYLPVYCELVKKQKQFKELQSRLEKGENLLIVEVDGPHQEDLKFYQEKYDVPDNFIENHSMLATEENLNIMLNDTKHPFGHGYCLAMALLGLA